jgi:hypothetical protein
MMNSYQVKGMTGRPAPCEPSGDIRRGGGRHDSYNARDRIGAKPRRRAYRRASERLAGPSGVHLRGNSNGDRRPVGMAGLEAVE